MLSFIYSARSDVFPLSRQTQLGKLLSTVLDPPPVSITLLSLSFFLSLLLSLPYFLCTGCAFRPTCPLGITTSFVVVIPQSTFLDCLPLSDNAYSITRIKPPQPLAKLSQRSTRSASRGSRMVKWLHHWRLIWLLYGSAVLLLEFRFSARISWRDNGL